jgi:enoyl-[acyl-carrier-protein] reductase (NADH)
MPGLAAGAARPEADPGVRGPVWGRLQLHDEVPEWGFSTFPKLGAIAATALLLASEAAQFINGEMIYVDGASATGWMGAD